MFGSIYSSSGNVLYHFDFEFLSKPNERIRQKQILNTNADSHNTWLMIVLPPSMFEPELWGLCYI